MWTLQAYANLEGSGCTTLAATRSKRDTLRCTIHSNSLQDRKASVRALGIGSVKYFSDMNVLTAPTSPHQATLQGIRDTQLLASCEGLKGKLKGTRGIAPYLPVSQGNAALWPGGNNAPYGIPTAPWPTILNSRANRRGSSLRLPTPHGRVQGVGSPTTIARKAVMKPQGNMAMRHTKQNMLPRTMQRPKTPQWWSKPVTQREQIWQ